MPPKPIALTAARSGNSAGHGLAWRRSSSEASSACELRMRLLPADAGRQHLVVQRERGLEQVRRRRPRPWCDRCWP